MEPFEFVIPRRPVSQQARRRDRLRQWREFVRTHAEKNWKPVHSAAAAPVSITVIYLYEEVALDVDNILKPIMDALVGLAFDDDSLVTDATSRRRRRHLRGPFRLEGASPVLAGGFELRGEFVYVCVADAPPQDELA
jgi:crossover junction endodeoxyribonuclease RusA